MKRFVSVVIGAALVASITACAPAAAPETPSKPSSEASGSTAPSPGPKTPGEATQALGACLNDKGWGVSVGSSGVSGMVPPEQRDQFQADMDACIEATGVNRPGEPVTPEFASQQYARTEAFRACLVANGFTPPELPSYPTYEDQLLIGGAIYDLGYLTGISPEDPILAKCDDPMLTWGH
ncbi:MULTISPECIES: hypothetical protein [unclassified Microbacterium]|uniref:hypothetical protein n=1 Tax=unclassified Microbacterium TaxID=2609290 RepID=UPI001AC1C970|nr:MULTISPECIES: hypothetical protein [unclassified Microbacterium]MBN9224267.1 hypothetical protein [Microbacterium sp.]